MSTPVPTPRGGARGAAKPPAASFPDAARHTRAVKARLRPDELEALQAYADAYHGGNISRAIGDAAVLATAYRESLGRP